MFKSLQLKYHSEIQEAKTTMLIYFNNSVGIGEHPQQLEEMDKLLDKIATAQDKLDQLKFYFNNYNNDESNLSKNNIK